MKFIIGGETGWAILDRLSYHGVIGVFWKTTLQDLWAYALVCAILILAAIGLGTVLRWILFGFPSKKKKY